MESVGGRAVPAASKLRSRRAAHTQRSRTRAQLSGTIRPKYTVGDQVHLPRAKPCSCAAQRHTKTACTRAGTDDSQLGEKLIHPPRGERLEHARQLAIAHGARRTIAVGLLPWHGVVETVLGMAELCGRPLGQRSSRLAACELGDLLHAFSVSSLLQLARCRSLSFGDVGLLVGIGLHGRTGARRDAAHAPVASRSWLPSAHDLSSVCYAHIGCARGPVHSRSDLPFLNDACKIVGLSTL